jgi:hypothetical protein
VFNRKILKFENAYDETQDKRFNSGLKNEVNAQCYTNLLRREDNGSGCRLRN